MLTQCSSEASYRNVLYKRGKSGDRNLIGNWLCLGQPTVQDRLHKLVLAKTKLADISFYFLDSNEIHLKHMTACRLAVQAFENAKFTFILTRDANESEQVNELLWNYPKDRFIPHTHGEESKDKCLIHIHHEQPQESHFLLINLGLDKPITGKSKRIFELVLPNETDLAIERRRHYEDLQCEISADIRLTKHQILGRPARD